MASTLALPTNSPDRFLSSLDVPPPSQDFVMHQVPDVFVIPPEEEQEENPPWCYFDAASAAAHVLTTDPDVDALDVALGLCQQLDNRAPSFGRKHPNPSQDTIIMPFRSNTLPRLNEIDLATEDGQTDIRSRGGGGSGGGVRPRAYDEEIVEVVKVRRNEGMADVADRDPSRTLKLKKSSTFRARATQALRSIKNVGKSTSRRATVSEPKPLKPVAPRVLHAADTLPLHHSYQEPGGDARPTSPTANRRRSMTLSQMFAFKENHKENQNTPVSPTSPMAEEPLLPTMSSYEAAALAVQPTSPTEVSGAHEKRLQPSPSLEDCMATPARSLSPGGGTDDEPSKPTLSKRKSFRRRLSVLELQKLFSIGSGSSSNSQQEAETSAYPPNGSEDLFSPPISRPQSMDSAAILSATSSRTSSTSFSETLRMTSRPSYSSQRSASRASSMSSSWTGVENDIHADPDEDLEMRLDSLHFDSLHFDPDEILSSL
ncbi:hypothetical protein BC628DRAFT_1415602 [Trametes gibbosa]|nr:hypothetical protein BC628DRAFT_1415602 [Trametes gibbosa]